MGRFLRSLRNAAATGLTALALASPLSGQEMAPGEARTLHAPPTRAPLEEVVQRSAASIVFNSLATGIMARLHGEPFWESAWKSLPVHAVNETVRTVDWQLGGTPYADNPLPSVVGRLANSAIVNIESGRPLCEDLETQYLALTVTYDCGDVDVSFDASPLLWGVVGEVFFGDLDAEATLRFGTPVFSYDRSVAERYQDAITDTGDVGDGPVRMHGFAFSGGFAYYAGEPSVPAADARILLAEYPECRRGERGYRTVQQYVEGYDAFPRWRTDDVQDHEMRHLLQRDLLRKRAESFSLDWLYPEVAGMRIPLGDASLLLAGLIIPYEHRPWEKLADTHALPYETNNEQIWIGRDMDGTPYFGR